MKKVIKISLLMMILMMFSITISYGFGVSNLGGDQSETSGLVKTGNGIIKIISTVGVVASVAMLIVLGIKYMMGSVEEKAEYKKSLTPYVIGAGLVFAASSIVQIIYDLAIKL